MTDVASRRTAAPKRSRRVGVAWLSDLVRLEILLWERVDGRLRAEHDLPLAHFESLWFLAQEPNEVLRVGDLAHRLGITVGGTSKIADRIAASGLIRRQPDPADGRVSLLVLTPKGRRLTEAAVVSYEAELTSALGALDRTEQGLLHALVRRLLDNAHDPYR